MSASGQSTETRCGFVALIGAPNAGKSTLLNALVGSKVSIVSRKAADDAELSCVALRLKARHRSIFVDTPGIFMPTPPARPGDGRFCLGRCRRRRFVGLLVDASKGVDEEVEAILAGLPKLKAPAILVLNKIDTVERSSLLNSPLRSTCALPFARHS